jgi:hypothetical protein
MNQLINKEKNERMNEWMEGREGEIKKTSVLQG